VESSNPRSDIAARLLRAALCSEVEGSRVSPDWHGWLLHTWDEAPSDTPLPHKSWEKPHVENLTGTAAAYAPKGSIRRADPAQRSDYEAWTPE